MSNPVQCPRCKGSELYSREMRAPEGLVIEEFHTCGYSKAKAILLPGLDDFVQPAKSEDWKPSPKQIGGYATKGKKHAKPRKKGWKKGVRVGPYVRRQNPRKIREALGYQHLGGLDTFRIPPKPVATLEACDD